MARRSSLGHLVLALAAAGLLSWSQMPGDLVFAKEPAVLEKNDLQSEVLKVAKPWAQPHKVTVSHDGYELSSISQGQDQWQLVLAEEGKGTSLLATKLGGNVAYGAEYDSTKSRYNISADGLRRVAASAASKESDSDDVDWTLRLEGDRGSHFSATGDGSSYLYDASLGLETPVAKGVTARYALDLKRRAGSGTALPSWVRQTAGLRYDSPAGRLKVNVQQADPDTKGQLGYEAVLEGDLTGPHAHGSPHYVLRAADGSYEAKVGLTGPKGLTGGLRLGYEDGKAAASGHGEYAATKSVAKGIDVSVDAKVTATSAGDEPVNLHPIGLTASADLASLIPSVVDKGSSVDLRARYKVGADKPDFTASAKLNKRLAALELAAEANLDEAGDATGKLSLSGSSNGVSARYGATSEGKGVIKHSAEVVYPADLKRGSARAYGRLRQSSDEHGGKPRIQLGLQYDADVTVAGRKLRVQGDSAAYDSGSQLLGDDGKAWSSAHLKRARQSAAALRKRIESSEGNSWVRK